MEFDEPDEFLEFVDRILIFSILRGQMDLMVESFAAIKVLIQHTLFGRDFHSVAVQMRDVTDGLPEQLGSMKGPPLEAAAPDDPLAVTIDQIFRLINY
jgi:hypothetical protein